MIINILMKIIINFRSQLENDCIKDFCKSLVMKAAMRPMWTYHNILICQKAF